MTWVYPGRCGHPTPRVSASFTQRQFAVAGLAENSGTADARVSTSAGMTWLDIVGLLLHVVLDTERLGKSAQDIAGELLDGTPRIRLRLVEGDDTLVVNVHTLDEREEQAITERMRELCVGVALTPNLCVELRLGEGSR